MTGCATVEVDQEMLKQELIGEVRKARQSPVEVIQDLSQRGYAIEEIQSVLSDLLSTGELQLTRDRLLEPAA